MKEAIAALTDLAAAETTPQSRLALERALSALGHRAQDYEPLLRTLLRRVEEHDRLQRLAATDPLTGLANRRGFDRALSRELSWHHRSGQPFALVALDVDDFKVRNDRFGHAAGDIALVALARLCEGCVRGSDLAARLGGDELALILTGTDEDGARTVADRIRSSARELELLGGPLHISIGISTARAEHGSGDVLLKEADKALYRDKWQRNKARSRARSLGLENLACNDVTLTVR